jgi:hypothetical protein
MRHVLNKTLYIVLMLSGPLLMLPGLQAQEPLGTVSNAATVLRQAIERMPQFTQEQKTWLRDAAASVGDRHSEWLQSMEPSLQLLYRAASIPDAHWGLPWEEEGFNTELTHLGPMRDLVAMAQRHAEAQLPHRPNAFLKDQFAALAAARHMGRDGPLISLLVEYALESRVVDALARHLLDLSDEALASLADQWGNSPAGGDLRSAVAMEKTLGVDWFIKRIRQDMEEDQLGRKHASRARQTEGSDATSDATIFHERSLADELSVCAIIEIGGLPIQIGLETKGGDSFFLKLGQKKRGVELVSADYEREEAVLIKDGRATLVELRSRQLVALDFHVSEETLAKVFGPDMAKELLESAGDAGVSPLAMIHETSADFGRLVEAVSLPYDAFRQWQADFEEEIALGNALTRHLLPDVFSARARADVVQVRRQMLTTAIDIVRLGTTAADKSVDPFGSGCFVYREAPNGFELASALTSHGKPVTLTVGIVRPKDIK